MRSVTRAALFFACIQNAQAGRCRALLTGGRHAHARAPRQALRAAAAPPSPPLATPLALSDAVLDGLDADQRAAVLAPLGHAVRVSAGPGSGKTRVLTRRVQALGEQPLVSLRSVLAISFTKKAAAELRARLSALLGPERGGEVRASTFHVWCARSLRFELGLDASDYYSLASSRLRELHGLAPDEPLPADAVAAAGSLDSAFSIADDEEARRVLKALVPDLQREWRRHLTAQRGAADGADVDVDADVDADDEAEPDWSPAALLKMVSLHKCTQGAARRQTEPLLPLLLRAYDAQLLSRNLLDFNDLLSYTLRALRELPRAAIAARARWRHVLVDEWQDSNVVMYELIRELSAPLAAPPVAGEPPRSLFVVGDADQSIYLFRGAMASNLEALSAGFARAFVSYALPNNYRSTPHITTVASAIIGRKGATVSALAPPSAAAAAGGEAAARKPAEPRQVLVVTTRNDAEQSAYVARTIRSIGAVAPARRGAARGGGAAHHGEGADGARAGADGARAGADEQGVPLSEICVLTRTNRDLKAYEDALNAHGVPYLLVGGTAFFSRLEVKDALAHVRLAIGPGEPSALRRAAGTPKRGLGKASLDLMEEWYETSAPRAPLPSNGAPAGSPPVPPRLSARDFLLALAPQPALAALAAVDGSTDLAALARLRAACPLTPNAITKLGKFGGMVARARARALAQPRLGAAIDAVLDESGLRVQLEERAAATRATAEADDGDNSAADEASDADEALERLARLSKLADADEQALTPSRDDVLSFLSAVVLDGSAEEEEGDGGEDEGGGGGGAAQRVRLMTLHKSKGLEFEVAFVTHCEDGTIPLGGWQELDDADLAEERRLLYVGATRAKSRLYFTWRKERTFAGKTGAFTAPSELSRYLVAARQALRGEPKPAIAFKKVASPEPKGEARTAVSIRYENAQNRAKLREFERKYC